MSKAGPAENIVNSINSNRIPDIGRNDLGAVMVSEWTVGTPERQTALVEAFTAAWKDVPWPQGLLSVNLMLCTDGATLLNYAQWTSEDAYQEFVRTDRQALVDRIDRAVPGIERSVPVNYWLYRSGVRQDPPPTGCIVVVSVEFDGSDVDRQRQWVDTVFDALASETAPHPGGISGHFHISVDGTRVLNYAEWTSEKAHRDALERSGQGTIGLAPKWRDVRNFPGIKSSGFKRYSVHRSFAAIR